MLSNVNVDAISDARGRHKNSYPAVSGRKEKNRPERAYIYREGPGSRTREFISEITRGVVNHP